MTVAILTEKPSQMRNIAKHFKATNQGGLLRANYKGQDVIITCGIGHLYQYDTKKIGDLVPRDKSAQYVSWDVNHLPWNMNDFDWSKIKLRTGVSSAVKSIKSAFSQADEIVISTDVDITGEGQLLAFEIIDQLGFGNGSKTISRLYFSDETDGSDVLGGFDNRKKLNTSANDPEYQMAVYRQRFDFGSMQFTRVAKYFGDNSTILRQGRLKSAMIRVIGEQEDAVKAYKKTPSYSLRYKDQFGNVFSASDAQEFPQASMVQLTPDANIKVDTKTRKKTTPPKLLTNTVLFATLEAKGFSSATLEKTYQAMYEAGVVSYPRTADAFVTPDQYAKLLNVVDNIARVVGVDVSHLTNRTPRKTHVKPGGVHGANRPGLNVPTTLESLDKYGDGAREIYETLSRNYLAMLCEDYEYDQLTAVLVEYPTYRSTLNKPAKAGWRAIYKDLDLDEDDQIGKSFGLTAKAFVHEGFPPKPVNPTSKWLYKQLSKAASGVDNQLVGQELERYERLLSQNNVKGFDIGIGTGATQVGAYNELVKLKYIKANRGKLTLTDTGRMSYLMGEGTVIASLTLTRLIYSQMSAIKAGLVSVDSCLSCLEAFVEHDKEQMSKNGVKMRQLMNVELRTGMEQAERFEMQMDGQTVRPKRSWAGYTFTDEEVQTLSQGGTITFTYTAKSGNPATATGKITRQEFNGKPFYGFENLGSDQPPLSWCKHNFTDEERDSLLAGEGVFADDFVSKAGKTFSATVYFKDEGGRKRIVPEFGG